MYYYYSSGGAYFREGVRNSLYVIDVTINAIGFAGAENTDWKNLLAIS